MLELKISVTVRPERLLEFFQTLDALVIQYQKENGCFSYEYFFDKEQNNHCEIRATWKSWKHIEHHFQSPDFSILLGAIKLLCLDRDLSITDGTRTEGWEYLEKCRRGKILNQD